MKIQVYEEKYEPPVELQRTKKIILTKAEYDNLKTAFCKGKGWNLDYPHTVNVHSITLKGIISGCLHQMSNLVLR